MKHKYIHQETRRGAMLVLVAVCIIVLLVGAVFSIDMAYMHMVRTELRTATDVCSYDVHIDAEGEEYFEQFAAICRLGKASKVVTLTVPSGELGTPFNEEVERLQRLVDFAEAEGVRVAMKSQIGRLSEDPDTVKVLCDNVKGLGLTLDPSHYFCGNHSQKNLDKIMEYVFHVHLRDSKKDELQVRVGQGEIDYAKVVGQLSRVGYTHALSIQMTPTPAYDQRGELRKLRLLLETLL